MADTYRAWLRGVQTWQTISVIDLRNPDGLGKRLQSAGLKTLGEIDKMEGPDLLKLEGVGIGVLREVRGVIRSCKAAERQRKKDAAPARLRRHRTFPG